MRISRWVPVGGSALALLAGSGTAAHAVGRCGDPAQRPWCETSLSPDARAGLLLGAMTQDEKISLLAGDDPFGVGGGADSHTGTSDGIERLGLPNTYYSDGPVGVRQGSATAMPVPMAVAASFDPAIAELDERTLREIYLPQFEAAVKEGDVGSVMCSYNKLNGQYACENDHLLQQILEREWGFKGYVLADYGAAHNTIASLNNGLDFEPWPGLAYSPTAVNVALAAQMASPSTVDDHIRRVLRTAFAYGFFDRPAYVNDDNQIDKAGHLRAAGQIEAAGVTLLKNDGILPLDPR